LPELLVEAEIVIYLGSNTDGTACGTRGLFTFLVHRRLLAHVPFQPNSLLVYGEPGARECPLVGEEYAILSGKYLSFDEAQKVGA
jgi:hypothetical protein